jgi:hypothetical protein
LLPVPPVCSTVPVPPRSIAQVIKDESKKVEKNNNKLENESSLISMIDSHLISVQKHRDQEMLELNIIRNLCNSRSKTIEIPQNNPQKMNENKVYGFLNYDSCQYLYFILFIDWK